MTVLLAYTCSPDSGDEISLKIGQYLMKLKRSMKLRRTKKRDSFLDHSVYSLLLIQHACIRRLH